MQSFKPDDIEDLMIINKKECIENPAKEHAEALLGCLEGVATFTMSEDWKITPEELFDQ